MSNVCKDCDSKAIQHNERLKNLEEQGKNAFTVERALVGSISSFISTQESFV